MNLTLWPALETPFLLLGCLVQLPYEGVYLVLLCLVLSCLAVFFWRLLFSEEEMEGGVDLGNMGFSGK